MHRRASLSIGKRGWVGMALFAIAMVAAAPPPRAGGPPRGGGGGGGFANAFPQHEKADQATIDRGKALYGVHCNFCHGSDARGGEGGPNLLRSDLVLNDKN